MNKLACSIYFLLPCYLCVCERCGEPGIASGSVILSRSDKDNFLEYGCLYNLTDILASSSNIRRCVKGKWRPSIPKCGNNYTFFYYSIPGINIFLFF